MPRTKKSKLYPFQVEDVAKMEKFNGRVLLGQEMGLGKTIISLTFVDRHVTGPTVVVCPAILKEHWRREAEQHLGRKAIILNGRTPHPLPRHRDIFIINYDIIGKPGIKKPTWCKVLKRLKPEAVVLDEITAIKEGKSQRSKGVKVICEKAKYVIGLSGTPIPNRPIEIWFPLHVIKPELFPSRWSFGVDFCNAHRGMFGWDFSGASNLDQLHKILVKNVLLRRKKIDVLKDLPSKTRTVISVEMNQRGRKDYEEAVKTFIQWLMKQNKATAMKARKMERAQKLGYLKRLAAKHKLPKVMEWIDNFLTTTNEKLLVFGIHKKILRGGLMKRYGDQAVLLDGTVPREKRQIAIDSFNNDKNIRLFFGNIHAAGKGWSCRSASNVLFVELDWVPGNHVQAEDRVFGIKRGTGKPVQILYAIAHRTVEEPLAEYIQSKSQTIAEAIDGDRGKADMKIFDILEQKLLAEKKVVPTRKYRR